MKYRIVINIFLDPDKIDDAKKIYQFIKQHRALFKTIRKGLANEERSFIRIEKCYHDEDPPRPCEVIEEIFSD